MSNKPEYHEAREDRESDNIRRTIAEMETAFNRHDADELDSHFTQNATFVNVIGERLSGWKQINEAHKVILAGALRNAYASYTIESLVFVHPDVAIAHMRQYPTSSEGEMIVDGQGSIAIYVMVKERDIWRVAAGQNTFVRTSSNAAP